VGDSASAAACPRLPSAAGSGRHDVLAGGGSCHRSVWGWKLDVAIVLREIMLCNQSPDHFVAVYSQWVTE